MQTPKLQNQSNPAFEGSAAFTEFLKFLDTNQAWGAMAIDVTCMGSPRTIVDFTRGPAAGLETMRREFSSTANNTLIGSYGVAAAILMSAGLSKEYGVKANKLFVSDEMLEILGNTWGESKSSTNHIEDYLNKVMSKTSGFNPDFADKSRLDKNGWVILDKASQEKFIKKLAEEIKSGPDKISKDTMNYLKSVFGESVCADNKIKLQEGLGDNAKKSVSNLESFIEDLYNVSKTLTKKNVSETFNAVGSSGNKFLNKVMHLNKKASIVGVVSAAAIGTMLQPINMYLTRKKTGQTGFVGVEGREPDKSGGFKVLKTAFAAAAGYIGLRTIGKPSEILGRIRFKGLAPTINHYKFVYAFTILSRLLSARDKNELREISIKDSLGFANWLILGGFVSKLTASGFEKMAKYKNNGEKFIRHNKNENGKTKFDWLTKSSILTRDEALLEGFKKAGVSTIRDGKALSFKEMLKEAGRLAKENPKKYEALAMATKKVRALGLIQFAGYVYSGLVLGIGIPKLNIGITKSVENARKAKEAKAHKKELIAEQK